MTARFVPYGDFAEPFFGLRRALAPPTPCGVRWRLRRRGPKGRKAARFVPYGDIAETSFARAGRWRRPRAESCVDDCGGEVRQDRDDCPICSVWRYRGNILARVGSAARSLNQNGAVLADVERVIPCRGQSGTSGDSRVRLPGDGPVGGRGDGPLAGAFCALLE